MGLDMYLRAERYVSGYSHATEPEQENYARLLEASGMSAAADPDTPSLTVSVTVAYWRKANQIHAWFVEHVQGGEDECRPHCVDRAQLSDLRRQCQDALAARDKVGAAVAERKLLPTRSGFFFGSTEYDEWYWSDLEDTVAQLDRVLANVPECAELEYQSSW